MPGPGGRTVGRANIRVSPDTSRFRSELQKDLKRFEESLRVNIPTRIDTTRLAADARRVRADLERQIGEVTASVDVDARGAGAQLDRIARDRTASVRVDVDRSGIDRAQAAIGGLVRSLGRLGGGAVGISALTGALSSLAAGAAAAVVPLVQLGTALAPAVGALAVLPGAAFAAGAALAPLAVALSGVGEAMGAALAGDAEALAGALEDLAPAARSVVTEVAALQPGLDALRESVQQGFFAPLVGEAAELGERLLPVLSDGMTRVGGALGEAAAGMSRFLGGAQSLNFLDSLFASTAVSVERATGTMPNFLSGLMALGSAGLPFVEAFGSAMLRVSERFQDWAVRAAETGQAHQWIQGAIKTFRQLGSILGNIGSIFGSIGQAAGDGGLLGTLDSLTGSMADFLNTSEGMSALQGLFQGLSDIGGALSPVLQALVGGIGTLAPLVGEIAQVMGPVLTSAINGLVPALAALQPGIQAVIGGLGEGIDALVASGGLEQLGTALSDILIALSPLLPVIGELAGLLAGALAEALIAIAPSLETLATALADELSPLLPELAAAFSELVAAVAPLIPPLVEALLPGLEPMPDLVAAVTTATTEFAGAIRDATPAILAIIKVIGQLAQANAAVMGAFYRVVAALFRWAGALAQIARNVAGTVLGVFGSLVSRGLSLFRTLRDGVLGIVIGLVRRVAPLIRGARDAITGALRSARDTGVEMVRGLRDGALRQAQSLVDKITGLPGRIRRALGNARSMLKGAGRQIIYGLIDGINSAVSRLWDRLSNIADNVRSYWPFSPAKRGPLRAHPMDEAGENLARMLVDGMRRGEVLVEQASARLAGLAVAPDMAALPAEGVMGQDAARRDAVMDRIAAALAAMGRQDLVVQVDSQEIARATRAGDRQLARR